MLKTQQPVGLSIGGVDSLQLHERKPVITSVTKAGSEFDKKKDKISGTSLMPGEPKNKLECVPGRRMEADLSDFNIDAPRWDQCTFLGRVKHFFNITDPRTVLVPERELDWAKVMVEQSRMGTVPPGTQVEQLFYAKKLYDSAFHPDTGHKMNVIGRMSFQVPGGMIITGFMLQFYRTMPAVIFWQWVNQSFNALVNYTNRNAASPTSVRQMAVSYITATTTAVATAVGMNMLTKRAPPLVGRWVPFAAVAAANCVNIPMMRQHTSCLCLGNSSRESV
ncbi:sideroflexin-2 isoform X4 [Bos taurus]|uniref:sideroflexin-2 isoform X4 n=1 Tax=Bos taurus TaxID=9913 RepID=UPI0028CBA412|nr:sideroflexin-2 isoform X4 [Bos taurus]